MFAANRYDINVGQSGVVDRALFYTKAYDKDHLNMSELEFRAWAENLKPWFQEYNDFLIRQDVREHYMRYFMDMGVDKQHVESIRHSSSSDHGIIEANSSWARRVAKFMIEEGRIFEDLSIEYPFTMADLNRRVGEVAQSMGFRGVQGQRVFAEFDDAGLIERYKEGPRSFLRFRLKTADIIDHFEKATGLQLHPVFETNDDDRGPNDCTMKDTRPWRGGKATKF